MVKDKPNQTRCYDADGFRRRAACVCVRSSSSSSSDDERSRSREILLVTASRHSHLWVIPGGGVEPDEDPERAAVREVREEAGVDGRVQRSLGVFENGQKRHRTWVYEFHVSEELHVWEDGQTRRRSWFQLDEAKRQLGLHKPVQKAYLDSYSALLLVDRRAATSDDNASRVEFHQASGDACMSDLRSENKLDL